MIDIEKADGLVSFGELKGFLMLNGLKMNDDEIDNFMEKIDEDNDGKISFEEFENFLFQESNRNKDRSFN